MSNFSPHAPLSKFKRSLRSRPHFNLSVSALVLLRRAHVRSAFRYEFFVLVVNDTENKPSDDVVEDTFKGSSCVNGSRFTVISLVFRRLYRDVF